MAETNQPARVIHGAIALIKSGGLVLGYMRSIQAQESFQRLDVQGLGTILLAEAPVTKFIGSLTCEFMSIKFTSEGVRGAIRRDLPNIASRVFEGEVSLEDQLVLDSSEGVVLEVYKKVTDIFNADKTIKPKAIPYAIIRRCLIESDTFQIAENQIGGHSQTFKYLEPIVDN